MKPHNERKSFTSVLQSIGMLDEFTTLCRAGGTTTDIRAWAKSKLPADVYVPVDLKSVRKQLGVSAGRGGARQGRGATVYSARGSV